MKNRMKNRLLVIYKNSFIQTTMTHNQKNNSKLLFYRKQSKPKFKAFVILHFVPAYYLKYFIWLILKMVIFL